jgi:hypothetical protein
VADPKAMIGDFLGRPLPDSLSVSIHEEAAGTLHFVIPARPPAQVLEELDDADLEQIAASGHSPFDDQIQWVIRDVLAGEVGGRIGVAAGKDRSDVGVRVGRSDVPVLRTF